MSDCILTDWPIYGLGYGVKTISKKTWYAHRYVWTQVYGLIPEGYIIHHKCENRACVNLEHLKLVKHEDHMSHHLIGHTWTQGSKCGTSKLIEQEVQEIIELLQQGLFTQKQIAQLYDVTQPIISRIKSGELWAHVSS